MSNSIMMTIARNATFQDRVKFSMQSYATTVMAEVNTVSGHASRVTFAEKVLDGAANVTEYAIGVCTNSTIAAEGNLGATDFGIPDSDIQFTVNSLFNAFAGIAN